MGWVVAAGEIPQRLLLHSPRSTRVSGSPLLQVCVLFEHHVNIILILIHVNIILILLSFPYPPLILVYVNIVLILSVSTGFNMGGAGRGYPFYDPISFQRQSQVCGHPFETPMLKVSIRSKLS